MAIEQNELLGYVYVEANPEYQDGSIEFIGTSEGAWNRGIGKKLLKKAIYLLFQHNEIKDIHLSVNASNIQAVKLYEKTGFSKEKTLVHFLFKR